MIGKTSIVRILSIIINNIMIVIFFICLRGRFPSLPWDFLLYLHNDPAAQWDHCGRCWIRTRNPEHYLKQKREEIRLLSIPLYISSVSEMQERSNCFNRRAMCAAVQLAWCSCVPQCSWLDAAVVHSCGGAPSHTQHLSHPHPPPDFKLTSNR